MGLTRNLQDSENPGWWPCWHLLPGCPLLEEPVASLLRETMSRKHGYSEQAVPCGTCFSPGLSHPPSPFHPRRHCGLDIILRMQTRRPRGLVQQLPWKWHGHPFQALGTSCTVATFLRLLDSLRSENSRRYATQSGQDSCWAILSSSESSVSSIWLRRKVLSVTLSHWVGLTTVVEVFFF